MFNIIKSALGSLVSDDTQPENTLPENSGTTFNALARLDDRFNFGPETMVFGECKEKVSALNGMVVEVRDEYKNPDRYKLEIGQIYNVYVNQRDRLVHIWVNFPPSSKSSGSGYARCFRPRHLEPIGWAREGWDHEGNLHEVVLLNDVDNK